MKIAALAITASLAAAGVATAAEAPVIGKQQTDPATTAPMSIGGTGVHKGDTLPKGAKLIYREVTLSPGQEVVTKLRAPEGTRLQGLALPEKAPLGFAVLNKRNYGGKHEVRFRVFRWNKATDRATGRIYALVR
jgi:hypothetical protein